MKSSAGSNADVNPLHSRTFDIDTINKKTKTIPVISHKLPLSADLL